MIRVRIAPSPTGIPHIGNTRTALFNWLFAKHNKGKFLLRIEDTDRARLVPESEKAIYEILEWLGFAWDEKYIQSERIEIYKKQTDVLVKKGFAYKDQGAIRFKVPKNKEVFWNDVIGGKKISFKTDVIEDFVILKSDGFPTYHLASVADDHLMNISHVIRGDEWISSTPKHLLLYEAFGWQPPIFAHLPVILGPDKTKLSKRHGAKSVLDYRDEGYLKEALLNFMALLGWNPGGEKEIMSFSEMIELFDLKDVNTNSPIFDLTKLNWLNGLYIRQLSVQELRSKIKDPACNCLRQKPMAGRQRSKVPASQKLQRGEQVKIQKVDDMLFEKLVALAQTRMTTLNDFYELTRFIFEEQKVKLNEKEKNMAKKLLEGFSAIEQWNNGVILKVFKEIIESEKVRMPVIYKIITGKAAGLPLPETLEILGKEKVIQILKKVISS